MCSFFTSLSWGTDQHLETLVSFGGVRDPNEYRVIGAVV